MSYGHTCDIPKKKSRRSPLLLCCFLLSFLKFKEETKTNRLWSLLPLSHLGVHMCIPLDQVKPDRPNRTDQTRPIKPGPIQPRSPFCRTHERWPIPAPAPSPRTCLPSRAPHPHASPSSSTSPSPSDPRHRCKLFATNTVLTTVSVGGRWSLLSRPTAAPCTPMPN